MNASKYDVPSQAQKVLEDGILKNPLMQGIPIELLSLSELVRFEGSSQPSIPINWRFAESISALKAFEALMLSHLITRKYGMKPTEITINTDHASLFFMSPLVAQVIKDGKPQPIRSMNPEPTLTALGLPMDGESQDTYDSVAKKFQETVSKLDSAEIDELMNEQYRQAGTIAWSSDEFFASQHGQENGRVGLYEISKDSASSQPASWWPENESNPSSSKRPLAGLKVVDLTRVIAGPAIGRGLAEMGASVMRVTSPNVTDLGVLHQDLNWGKWNCHLDLKSEADKEKLRQLIKEADVVVDGYRPGVMERLGFGRQAVLDLVKDRPYGIIHVRENCYGWHGPWQHRSGWQQISDACCGVSLAYGRAMGNDEAVTPVFPNSDYCTGVCGSTAVLAALIKRAEEGGSYGLDVSLNYYSQWLVRSCGVYSDEVWKELWSRHGSPVFRHYHNMLYLLPAMMRLLQQHDAATLFQPRFFEPRHAKYVGATFVQVKPIAQFHDGAVEFRYNVGTRSNGVDEPIWPRDLTVEVVGKEAASRM
ncbi:hypothetical protein JX265_011601 [Neoarthrinium moseri]|uniref:Uncharacterized protein n=1 Tax=Neoarthrinium moseri TaxID=1658444 RepID=A0A9P9WBV4_9PEZI|nr:hypothetical protein JX265_011601 [Neoarthrinium moseri]